MMTATATAPAKESAERARESSEYVRSLLNVRQPRRAAALESAVQKLLAGPRNGLRFIRKKSAMTERSTVTGSAAISSAANGGATSVRRRGYPLVAGLLLVTMLGATLSIALYVLHERRMGFGPLRVTVLLAVSLFALVMFGYLSDHIGRRKVIAGQLTVSLDHAQLHTEFRRIADEQAALRRVATLVAQGAPPPAVFDAVAAEIQRLLDADGVTLGRYEPGEEVTVVAHRGAGAEISPPGTRVSHQGQNVTTLVRRSQAPTRVDHYEDTYGAVAQFVRSSGVRVSVGAPVVVDGRPWGVAIAYWTRQESPSAGTEERMAQFAQLLETAIANAESRAELLTSRARIVAAADDARRRIERDLHDGAQQRLVSLALYLQAAQAAVTPELGELGAQLDRAVAEANGALDELRETARGIHPTVLARGGLRLAVKTLARRAPVPVNIDMRVQGRLPEQVEVSAYYVIAEALTNAAKHAGASAIMVTVNADADAAVLRVAVRDDGAGGAGFGRGTGLVGLKDRVEALGGQIFLGSPPGAGTSLRVELPLAG